MLELLPSMLKLRHLLLDVLSSLSLIMQLFFQLLDRGDSKTTCIRILSNVTPLMHAAAVHIEY